MIVALLLIFAGCQEGHLHQSLDHARANIVHVFGWHPINDVKAWKVQERRVPTHTVP